MVVRAGGSSKKRGLPTALFVPMVGPVSGTRRIAWLKRSQAFSTLSFPALPKSACGDCSQQFLKRRRVAPAGPSSKLGHEVRTVAGAPALERAVHAVLLPAPCTGHATDAERVGKGRSELPHRQRCQHWNRPSCPGRGPPRSEHGLPLPGRSGTASNHAGSPACHRSRSSSRSPR